MRFGTLHWPAILFGAAAGLFTSMVLFAVLAGIGSNTGVQAILMLIGFFVAGVVAGRFTPSDPQIAGGAAALVLFFVLAVITIGGAGTNLLGVVVFGIGAAILGPIGGVVGSHRRSE